MIYDVNVWNRGAYLTADLPVESRYDDWMLCPYELGFFGYGTGKHRGEFNLFLTKQEVAQLKLSEGEDDEWIDTESFALGHPDMPVRVQAWLDGLPEYGSTVES